MQINKLTVLAVLALIFFVPTVYADCEYQGTGKIVNTPVGCYDYFVYAQLWAAQAPYASRSSGIPTKNPAEQKQRKQGFHSLHEQYAATHMTPHGLWPNFSNPIPTYPADCDSPQQFILEDFPAELRQELDKLFPPIVYGLDKHEWEKHGTCIGWTAQRYFEEIAKLNQRQTTPKLIQDNIGKTVNYTDLLAAYGNEPQHTYLSCDDIDQQQYLTQIFTLWDKDLNPISLTDFKSITPCDPQKPIHIRQPNQGLKK